MILSYPDFTPYLNKFFKRSQQENTCELLFQIISTYLSIYVHLSIYPSLTQKRKCQHGIPSHKLDMLKNCSFKIKGKFYIALVWSVLEDFAPIWISYLQKDAIKQEKMSEEGGGGYQKLVVSSKCLRSERIWVVLILANLAETISISQQYHIIPPGQIQSIKAYHIIV